MAVEKPGQEAISVVAGLVLAVIVSLPGLLQATSAVSPPAPPGSQTVKGEVVLITDAFYVVQETVGKGMVQVLLDKDTELDRSIKAGAQIEARLAPVGVALSIKETNRR